MIRIYNQNNTLFIGEKILDVVGIDNTVKNPLSISFSKEGIGLGKLIGLPEIMTFVGVYSFWDVTDKEIIKSYKEVTTGLTLVS